MNQEQFNFPPASHSVDPPSSHLAEHAHTNSGQRKTNLHIVVNGLKQHRNSTGAELAHYLNMDVYEVRRRLSDAKGMTPPLVRQKGMRPCRINKKSSVVWDVV